MGGKMSPEWWRERYRNMTPKQRKARIKQSNDCRRNSMATNSEYRERWLTKNRERMRLARRDPEVLLLQRDAMRKLRATRALLRR